MWFKCPRFISLKITCRSNICRECLTNLEGADSIVLSCIFPTFNDCIGWNLPGEKSHQVFRIIIRPVRHAVISGSLMLVELLLRQPGVIPIALFTANVQPTGCKADNNWFLFMKSKGNQRRDSCSRDVQMAFRILFKCRLHHSNVVHISIIYQYENQL